MGEVSYQRKFKKNDEYLTPEYAVLPIVKYLNSESTIWCPFDKEDSAFVKVFKAAGHNVIYSHIDDGEDFFNIEVPECDYIISNPPFSKRTEILQKLCEIGKPFALLINFQGIFDSKIRFDLATIYGFQLCYLYPRVSYTSPVRELTATIPFQSGYLCYKILNSALKFEYVDKSYKL